MIDRTSVLILAAFYKFWFDLSESFISLKRVRKVVIYEDLPIFSSFLLLLMYDIESFTHISDKRISRFLSLYVDNQQNNQIFYSFRRTWTWIFIYTVRFSELPWPQSWMYVLKVLSEQQACFVFLSVSLVKFLFSLTYASAACSSLNFSWWKKWKIEKVCWCCYLDFCLNLSYATKKYRWISWDISLQCFFKKKVVGKPSFKNFAGTFWIKSDWDYHLVHSFFISCPI